MSLSEDLHTIPRLFGDAVEQLGKLIRNEAQLAKAELSQKVRQAAAGATYVAAGGILTIPVVVMLLFALAAWLYQMGLSPALSCLVAAAVGAAVSAVLAIVGLSYLKGDNLLPKETLRQLERDVATAKELAR